MRMHAKTIGGAMVGLALTMLGSPPAQADNDSFVNSAKVLGLPQAADNLISTGRSGCYFLSLNRDPDQITERIARYLVVDTDVAHRFFVLAVGEYCPQFGGLVGA